MLRFKATWNTCDGIRVRLREAGLPPSQQGCSPSAQRADGEPSALLNNKARQMNANIVAHSLIVSLIIEQIRKSPMTELDKRRTHQQMMDGLDEACRNGDDLWAMYEQMVKVVSITDPQSLHTSGLLGRITR